MKNALLNFWKKHRKAIILIGLLTIAATILLPHLAFAQATPAVAPSSDEAKLQTNILSFLRLLMEWMQRVLWPVLLMIGGLMNNDLLFGAGMEQRSLLIWQNIRDLVNVLFVLILLAIALYNVVGGHNQEFQLKTVLPKFVIALIAVNFSFIGLKIVLDGVNVVSTAIFAMPDSVQKGLSDLSKNPELDKKVCQGLYGVDTAEYTIAVTAAGENALCAAGSPTFTDSGKIFFARFGAQNAAVVLAINYGNIADYDKVKLSLTNTTKLVINIFFSVVFYLIYAVSFVALMLVLLVRVIVLWLLLVLSPLAALTMVLPKELTSGLGEAGNLKEQFVSHAIVPIPIALVMTIGFILLDGFNKSILPGASLNSPTIGVGLLVSGVSTFQDLIIAIAGVGFIWTGVFAAADKTMAKSLTGKLKTMAQGAGSFVATSWQYAPFIPVKGAVDEKGKPLKISLAGAMGMGGEMVRGRELQASTESQLAAKGFGNFQAMKYAGDISARAADGNVDKLEQAVANAKHVAHTLPIQQALGKAMGHPKINAAVTLKLKGTEILDDTGSKIEPGKLAEKLAAGKVKDTSMSRIAEILGGDKKPEALKEDKAAGPAGTGMDADTADSVMKADGGAYSGALGGADNKALEDYKKAKANKKSTPKQKEAALKTAQGALGRLNAAMEGRNDATYTAATAGSLDKIQEAVTKRRKQLADAKVDASKIDGILKSEFGSPDVAANIEKQGGKVDDLITQSAAAVAAEPAPTPAPAPAAAKPKAPPTGAAPKPKPKPAPAPAPAPTAPLPTPPTAASYMKPELPPIVATPGYPGTGPDGSQWTWDGAKWLFGAPPPGK